MLYIYKLKWKSFLCSFLTVVLALIIYSPVIMGSDKLPDIYIDSIEVVPYRATELTDGERAVIKCTVKKVGPATGEFFVAFYQGTKLIKNIRVKPSQFKGGIKILETGFKYNKSITSHSCIADSRNTIQESDETNNRMEKDTSSKQGGSIIITGTLVVTNIDVIQVE